MPHGNIRDDFSACCHMPKSSLLVRSGVRVTNVARLLRGLLPVLAASAAATVAALPAAAQAATSPATKSPAVARADQWWLTALHASAALPAAPEAGKGVTVAVLSTGVEADHPDLTGTVTEG